MLIAQDQTNNRHDLEVLVKSRVPIIVVESHEERRVIELFRRMLISLGKPLFAWTVTEGMHRLDIELDPQRHNAPPEDALRHIKATSQPGVYLLLDFHPYMQEPLIVRLLKEIAQAYVEVPHTLVLVSHALEVPAELRHLCADYALSMPNPDELDAMIRGIADEWSVAHQRRKVRTDRQTLDLIIRNLTGLTLADARRVARMAIYNDGALTRDDLPQIARAKYELFAREAVLSLEVERVDFDQVAGLAALKTWLTQRKGAFRGDPALRGIDAPKGVLLTGVQGCGKSLAARAAAGLWEVPLLRLDFGALYNKFHGETERNLREALKTAEVMAPCVLWIDEIEKGIATDAHDSGTSKRVLGTLLTWMAERAGAVFIVATANDIQALPPELIRKGRLDEIFFVDLPAEAVRRQVFEIHMARRGHDPSGFDTVLLARLTGGFSGAEIEQAVVAAMYTAHAHNGRLDTAAEIDATRPLSVVMSERIAALRAWAAERAVPAD
jgi:hypothetical protein